MDAPNASRAGWQILFRAHAGFLLVELTRVRSADAVHKTARMHPAQGGIILFRTHAGFFIGGVEPDEKSLMRFKEVQAPTAQAM